MEFNSNQLYYEPRRPTGGMYEASWWVTEIVTSIVLYATISPIRALFGIFSL